MTSYTCTYTVKETIHAETPEAAARKFAEAFDFPPETVGGRKVLGCCDWCDAPYFAGCGINSGDSEETVCVTCYEKFAQLEPTP